MQQLNIYGKTKTESAIKFIQDNAPKDNPYMLCYSGGKDSIVLEHLTRQAGVHYSIFYSLMPDPPEIIKFIKSRNFQINILSPELNFWGGIVKNFPPHRKARWCCTTIKEKPSTKIPLTHRLLGIRAEESRGRAKQGFINQRTKKRINYHPIFDWLEWEIWEYIERYGIEYCSLYDEGFSRIGCLVCPMRSTAETIIWKNRWPKYYRLFEKKCRDWWTIKGIDRQIERGGTTNFDEWLLDWYRGKQPQWRRKQLKNKTGDHYDHS